ncbi:MAG: NAD-dependent epimerase/dehydratase [Sphingomonas bacterium]|uniref:NAD(P)-dependent oxidoreductase n=1 Tax=Sphingomonas bacterium TaxID=1895847 RepID=UPI0026343705|nr:NAD(P)H-binding protein [Sphingomonas bacterium]MDB5712392.1 NAD-dependent epimerase/dehydratase [Sphingomonas bacterium]
MKVALIGASGKVGQRLVAELTGRAHEVTGVARQPAETGVPMMVADANDRTALAAAIRGNDALMVAGRFVSMDAATILGAVADAGVPRLLVVGGAGTLFIAPGLQLVDAPGMPAEFLPEVRAGKAFLEALQASDAEWSFLSPAAQFAPGERTGTYRLGGDDLMRDDAGNSRISYEDLAKALVDELEVRRHSRQRFSIAY